MRELDRLNTLFEVGLYILVILPFLMIALGGAVGPVMGAIFVVGLPTSAWVHRRGLARAEQARWWNLIALTFVALTGAQIVFTETTLLAGGVRFVLVLTLIKLFSRLSERDEMQIFALSFLGLAAATTVNEDVTFGVLYTGYVLIGTFTLAVFHLRSELAARPRLALRAENSSLNRGYIAVLGAMGLVILSASLAIFFIFPRIGLGFFAQQSRDGVSVAGFNDAVELGGHGAIRDNPEVVMRVEFLDGTPPDTSDFHWRTLSFDKYDGRRWSRTLTDRPRLLRTNDAVTDLSRLHHSSGLGTRMQIYLEPLGKDLLPVVRPSASVRLGITKYVLQWGPRAGYVRADRYDDLHHTIPSEVGTSYILTLAEATEPMTRVHEPTSEFLQLPRMSARVRSLAHQITRDAKSTRDRAEAIRDHLRTQYTYTTDLPEIGGDPIDAFLFQTRRGHCEYFATAAVLLLRENGIPARLVNGFLGGHWNGVGNYLAVRQGDAHSWAEYWDPRMGWTQLDATPASDSPEEAALIDAARATFDALRLRWMKWVIEYDLNAQVEVFRRIAGLLEPRGLTGEGTLTTEDEARRTGDWRTALLIAGLATLLFFAFHRTRRRLRRDDATWKTTLTATAHVALGMAWTGWFEGFELLTVAGGGGFVALGVLAALFERSRGGDAQGVASLFATIERAAAAQNLRRANDEGPAQYLKRLARERPGAATDLDRFAARYLRARFGGEPPGPEELARLRAAARRITEKLRKN